jgi:hypothetical protein
MTTKIASTICAVPDDVTGKTNEATRKHHSKTLHAKLKRKRNKRKLARKLIRSAETSFWSELDAASEPDVDQSVEFPTSLRDLSAGQPSVGTRLSSVDVSVRAADLPRGGNCQGKNTVQGTEADAKSSWKLAREFLKIFLEQFWRENPCTGDDQEEFERLDNAIQTSPDWITAKQNLIALMRYEGVEGDRVDELSGEVLEKLYWEAFDLSQPEED